MFGRRSSQNRVSTRKLAEPILSGCGTESPANCRQGNAFHNGPAKHLDGARPSCPLLGTELAYGSREVRVRFDPEAPRACLCLRRYSTRANAMTTANIGCRLIFPNRHVPGYLWTACSIYFQSGDRSGGRVARCRLGVTRCRRISARCAPRSILNCSVLTDSRPGIDLRDLAGAQKKQEVTMLTYSTAAGTCIVLKTS
jgi:hypothetical protein